MVPLKNAPLSLITLISLSQSTLSSPVVESPSSPSVDRRTPQDTVVTIVGPPVIKTVEAGGPASSAAPPASTPAPAPAAPASSAPAASAPAPSGASSSGGDGSSSYTSDDEFQAAIIKATNFYRGQHGASDLTWNSTSASYAQNWANPCAFKHSGGPTGENLAAGYDDATASVNSWGQERTKYTFDPPMGFTEDTGHFTQLVWKATTSVGCGRKQCDGSGGSPGWYVVCEYYPPGNMEGDENGVANGYFKDNVLAQTSGQATDEAQA